MILPAPPSRLLVSIVFAFLLLPTHVFGQNHIDSDGDGMPDYWEIDFGLNPNSAIDGSEDPDGDSLNNLQEFLAATHPLREDTDFDFVRDADDRYPVNRLYIADQDNDGIPDAYEILNGSAPDTASDAQADFDGDGLNQLEEFLAGTLPFRNDSDADGVLDGDDLWPLDSRYTLDSDQDGLPDAFENQFFFLDDSFAEDAQQDFDADRLSNLQEFQLGTNPNNPDSDADGAFDDEDIAPTNPLHTFDDDQDGLPNEWEERYGFNPFARDSQFDFDFDQLSNLEEFNRGLDPNNVDSDFDGIDDANDHFPLDSRFGFDSDRDGMPDEYEQQFGFDHYRTEDGGFDNDSDQLTNSQEFFAGTDPRIPDSDYDGVIDGDDLWPTDRTRALDSDNDGIYDAYEIIHGFPVFDAYDAEFDDDGDGLNRLAEFKLGTSDRRRDSDGDGVDDQEDRYPTNAEFHSDSDEDGMPDAYEARFHFLYETDPFDATFDYDGDTLTNLAEYQAGTNPEHPDSDADGWYDDDDIAPTDARFQLDDDNDGLPNAFEQQFGLDLYRNDSGDDLDNDGLSNLAEFLLGTRVDFHDSDLDGLDDGEEHFPLDSRYHFDSDRDGMPDEYERQLNPEPHDIELEFDPHRTEDGGYDPDGDQLTNSQEFFAGTDPRIPDSDYDGVIDGDDLWPTDRTRALDSDNDGIYDAYEIIHGFPAFDPYDAEFDYDGDGLNRLAEFKLGTSDRRRDSDGDGVGDQEDRYPTNAEFHSDSDEDGMPDAYEARFHFLYETDPFDATFDYDGDTLTNLAEYQAGTNPEHPDSDADGWYDDDDIAPTDARFQLDDDNDGLPNAFEQQFGLDLYRNDSGDDLDNDGLSNLAEFLLDTRVDLPDSDGDGLDDGREHFPLDSRYHFDSDRDGMPDEYERQLNPEPHDIELEFDPHRTEDGGYDPDGDQLTNSQEFFAGTDPRIPDSDYDGVIDGDDLWPADRTRALDSDNDGIYDAHEIINGFLPYDSYDAEIDHDGDGLDRLAEFKLGTSDHKRDSDGDGVDDQEDRYPTNAEFHSDSDEDGMPDAYEARFHFLYETDPFDATFDYDGDTLSNLAEFQAGTNPEDADTDQDGRDDADDVAPSDARYQRDDDNDGLPNEFEYQFGLDPYRHDSGEDLDGDRLSNLAEFLLGTRVDSPDSDDDGWFDGEEHFPLDARYRFDSDRDGMPDAYEQQLGFDPFRTEDGGYDLDFDTLTNSQEYFAGTNPSRRDTDFDGVEDGEDRWPIDRTRALDSDNDGIHDAYEIIYGFSAFDPNDANVDEDFDGLSRAEEFALGTSDRKLDSDDDGADDRIDVFPTQALYQRDSDEDGMPDAFELHHQLAFDYPEDAHFDLDMDGLSNLAEFLLGTSPHLRDSDEDGSDDAEDIAPLDPIYGSDMDNDGLPDAFEYEFGLDPYRHDSDADADQDGLSNLDEFRLGTSPIEPDSDHDGLIDGDEHFPLDASRLFDSDRDGMHDLFEIENGLDHFRTEDGGEDRDGDGLSNSLEHLQNTFLDLLDSDFDGIPDNDDLWPRDATRALDSDEDGLSNAEELALGEDPFTPTAKDDDRDDDGLSYGEELALGTSDNNSDSDHDGVLDNLDRFPLLTRYSRDSDSDGLPDVYEIEVAYSDPNFPQDAANDSDGDGLSGIQEFAAGTDPLNPDSDGDGVFDGEDPAPLNPTYIQDTDGDGIPDFWEIEHGTDPMYPDAWRDADTDRRTNLEEYLAGTSAINHDSDGDGFDDLMDRFPTDSDFFSDRDRDGIPASWESEYGLSDDNPLDRNEDFDNDGHSNYEEYAAKTNPLVYGDHWQAERVETISNGNLSAYDFDEAAAAHTLTAEGQAFGQWVDNISFAATAISGDVDIQVQLVDMERDYATGGIMLRSTMDFGSPRVANIIEKQVGLMLQTRQFEYTPYRSLFVSGPQAGSWLRLVKKGDVISSFISNDGRSWGFINRERVDLGDTFFVGLTGTTNENFATNDITFNSLRVYQR